MAAEFALVALRYEASVLLGRMTNKSLVAADGDEEGPLGFPGGTRRKGERLIQTARRELYEETPFKLKVGRFAKVTDWQVINKRGEPCVYTLYHAWLRPSEFKEKPEPKNGEFSYFVWTRIPDIPWQKTGPGTEPRVRYPLENFLYQEMRKPR